MSIDIKVLNETFANRKQQNLKKYCVTKLSFTEEINLV